MPHRYALYYAPPRSHPLWQLAAQWLGRDAGGAPVPPADIPGIDTAYRMRITQSARRYGFHATIKAPMALRDAGAAEALETALVRFGETHRPVAIGRLVPRLIGGFIALVPEAQSAALTRFAAEVVEAFDSFRAPLTDSERERRTRDGRLTAEQLALLERWGYPHVMEDFQFHMTLVDSLPEGERAAVLEQVDACFAPVLREPFVLDRIALFHETEAGGPFVRREDFLLSQEVDVDA